MMTAYGTTQTAIEAMKLGAFDYLQKPLPSPAALRQLGYFFPRVVGGRPPEILEQQTAVGGSSAGMAIMGSPLREARESFEREYLKIQIRRFSGNISRTASFIGMERSALHRKLKALGIGDKREGDE